MNQSIFLCSVAALAVLSGCTSITVDPLPASHGIRDVCIEKNERVIRRDFLPTLEKGFQQHGIGTQVYEKKAPVGCEFIVSYTATQAWDLAMVLKDAEVWIRSANGERLAYGNYHLRAGGGLSLTKWQGAEKKILPVMDRLLVEYR